MRISQTVFELRSVQGFVTDYGRHRQKQYVSPSWGGGGGDIMTGLSKGVWNAITVLFDTEEDIRKLKSQALVMNYLFAIPWKVLRNKTVQPCSIILKIEVSR